MTTTTIVRFSSQDLAWSYAKLVARLRSFRVADYGVDSDPDEPFWLRVDQLTDAAFRSQTEVSLWKASGSLT